MSYNENSFTHDGVEYVAVDCEPVTCSGCHLLSEQGRCMSDIAVACAPNWKKDGREVIFKKKVES